MRDISVTGEGRPVVSLDSGTTWNVLAIDTYQTALGIATGGSRSAVYDPATDTLYVCITSGNDATHRVAKLTPVSDSGVWTNITLDIGTGSFGLDNLAVIPGPGQPLAHIADRDQPHEFGQAAIILAGENLVHSVYYVDYDALTDGGAGWTRCIDAPVRDDGTWLCRDAEDGKYMFGFHDEKLYRGDVVAGVMTATLAPATLDAGDKANYAVWLGGFVLGYPAGCYLIAAEGGLYQTWDRGETIEKVRPATGYPALPAGAHPKQVGLSIPAL
jgi:hypothetical protein